jgi:hypothetical protein
MDSIAASLKNLDVHQASLRRTLDTTDSTIPFLKLTSDDEIEAEGAEGVEGEGAADEATPGGGEAVPPPEGDNDDPPPASSPRGGQ